jgi:putative FmdB family regulatory protein
MAVYEYECQACGQRFEVTAPMSEYERLKKEPPACPGCGKQQTQQVVSLFSCKPASTW